MVTAKENYLQKICYEIPKAELHIHIEGSLEPELMFEIAKRNNILLPYPTVEDVKKSYDFANLEEFLEIYYQAAKVLLYEKDFEDLMYNYIKKASSQGVKYTEIFFDPQSHTHRGVTFETVINGLKNGIKSVKKDFNFEANLIMCFLRDLTEEEAFKTLEQALPFKDSILAIGLDSNEIDNPPEKFKNVFEKVRELGFNVTIHSSQEGHSENIRKSVEILHAERIDHGIQITDNEDIMKLVADKRIPLTLCPLSNFKLKEVPSLETYKLKEILNFGIIACINSDDPAYFGGYIGDNYSVLLKNLNLTLEELITIAKNSFKASFLNKNKKDQYLKSVDEYVENLNNN